VNSVDWSPDFTRLATASEDGTAIIWDAESGEASMHLDGHITGGINQAAWSPEGNFLATAGDDGFIQIWDTSSARILNSIDVNSNTGRDDIDDLIVYSLAWSPDGDYLATGSGDGSIRLWDANTGQNLAVMRGHENFVSYLAWSPDDQRLLSTGADGNVRIWNTDQDRMLLSLPYGEVGGGEWSPNGNEFLVSADVIAVWDLQKKVPIMETSLGKDSSWIWVAFYSPEGDYILARTVLGWGDTTDANKFWLLDSQSG
jgi:WD40 repeat protein